MRLKQVIYWSVPYDFDELDSPEITHHVLNGEIALVDEEGTATYWSWEQSTDSYDSTIFSIRSRALSFFTPDSLVSRDMSSHPWWLPFVGFCRPGWTWLCAPPAFFSSAASAGGLTKI